jgi:hypothetical protein
MKKLTVTLLTVAVTATCAFAGTSGKSFKTIVAPEECKFRDQEFQFDAFGAGIFAKNARPGWGGGVGINYFFTKYIGIGIEQDIIGRAKDNDSNAGEWATSGNLFLRYPICSINLAPYILAGGGAAYGDRHSGHGFGNVGGGLEYRVTNNVGIFSDARYVYSSEDPKNACQVRSGLRFAF